MSRVIVKMSFKHPNRPDTVKKNISHITYISTRSGVDKSITEADLQKELSKGIDKVGSDDEIYLKYIHERPKSHGLFGVDGIEDPAAVKKELTEVKSYVWRAIVSLREEDAKKLGYFEKAQWENLLRKKMPDVAKEMGISITNLRWVAAVHMEKGHPHAHIMFWEKEPKRTLGVIKTRQIESIRKTFTDEIFEEERFNLLTEKNAMRDYLRELAVDDISEITRILKEVKATGVELKSLMWNDNQEGLAPRIFEDQEITLTNKIQNLSQIMPGKGRISFKFMPEEVKEATKEIADYLLSQPYFAAALERNLKAVENLAKMYTGQEEAIKKARDNAYNDIRYRISQIILKGAAEINRENILHIDQELALKASEIIKNIDSKINLIPEQSAVLSNISKALLRANIKDEEIFDKLTKFIEKEGIHFKPEDIKNIIDETKKQENEESNILEKKYINVYLAAYKMIGCTEKEAFELLKIGIKNDMDKFKDKIDKLHDEGFLEVKGDLLKLSDKGVKELLKVKKLDKVEQEIFSILENNSDGVTFEQLITDKDVFNKLVDKDPEEVKVSKFDLKVRELFGENNSLTLNDLENVIFKKYNIETQQDVEKAEKEIEIFKKRIEKLCLNGYVSLDKETGICRFTKEGEQELKKVPSGIEFSKYDASVTLKYFDIGEGKLYLDKLQEHLEKEIVNQTALKQYDKYKALLESKRLEKYVIKDEKGILIVTEEGEKFSKELSRVAKYFYFAEAKGNLNKDKLKEIIENEVGPEKSDIKYKYIEEQLEKQIKKGNVLFDKETETYFLDQQAEDIRRFIYFINKEPGTVNAENLQEILESRIENKEAKMQFEYLSRRLKAITQGGYLAMKSDEKGKDYYIITDKGKEEREELLLPERGLLRKKLKYLERLGLIQNDGCYKITPEYTKYMKNKAEEIKSGKSYESQIFSKDIIKLIEQTENNINLGKIEREKNKLALGKYLNGEYEEVKADYENIREYAGINDTISKTLKNLATTLLLSGSTLEETKTILMEWNLKSNSNVPEEKMMPIIDKAYEVVKENDTWGKITVISKKDWDQTFIDLGMKEPPEWMYKGENWEQFRSSGLHLASIVNGAWKGAWRELERDRLQTEAQAEMMKKQQIRAQSKSKQAQKEEMKKRKSSSLYQEEDLDFVFE